MILYKILIRSFIVDATKSIVYFPLYYFKIYYLFSTILLQNLLSILTFLSTGCNKIVEKCTPYKYLYITYKDLSISIVAIKKFAPMDIINRKCSNAVGPLRQRSQLDRTVTSVWQQKRAFDNVHTPPRGGTQLKNKGEDTK